MAKELECALSLREYQDELVTLGHGALRAVMWGDGPPSLEARSLFPAAQIPRAVKQCGSQKPPRPAGCMTRAESLLSEPVVIHRIKRKRTISCGTDCPFAQYLFFHFFQ